MSRIAPLSGDDVPEYAAVLELIEASMGFVPNSVLTMAKKPALFDVFLSWSVVVLNPTEIDPGLAQLIAHVASTASGYRYCQAHTAAHAAHLGVAKEKVAHAFEFDTSPLFNDDERVARRVAFGAGVTPNEASDTDFDALRERFSEEACIEIVAVIAYFGFLNRWNDTMTTTLEETPPDLRRRSHRPDRGLETWPALTTSAGPSRGPRPCRIRNHSSSRSVKEPTMHEPTTAPPTFDQRQAWDLAAWPEMYHKLQELQAMIFFTEPGLELNLMVFTMASLAAGCRHCQAHGAYGLDGLGVDLDKITALWTFETSDLFDDRQRAALRFGLAAGSAPNAVSPAHHDGLRRHFTATEVRTLLGVVGISGFMNRFNDSLATVTDAESSAWAAQHLAPLGWTIGKHIGAEHEQRPGPPGGRH